MSKTLSICVEFIEFRLLLLAIVFDSLLALLSRRIAATERCAAEVFPVMRGRRLLCGFGNVLDVIGAGHGGADRVRARRLFAADRFV